MSEVRFSLYETRRKPACDNSQMNVTMKDIAEELGVSIGTVSKVLRDHPDISPTTRDKIRKRMQELNYRPNLAARALVTGRSHTVGLVVPDLVHPFFGQVATALSKVLHNRGYSLILSSSEEDAKRELRVIDQLLARRVDALILASSQAHSDYFEHMEKLKIPFVLVDRRFEHTDANFVGADDERIGNMATAHLIERGCRLVAHIGGPDVSTAVGRLRGYQHALAIHGFVQDSRYIIHREHVDAESDVTGYEAMRHLLTLKPLPDGVFCYNDPTAMGAMQAILEQGLRIPGDIALVGSGNVRYAQFLRVPLTTIDQQSEQIGDLAAKLALKLIGAKSAPQSRSVLIEPRLIVRESSLKMA